MAKNLIKLTLTLDPETGQGSYKFSPGFDKDTFIKHYSNLLTGVNQSAQSLCSFISLMRPVTQEERDAHIYVFKTDDKEDQEHKLYAVRKNLYENMATMFSTTLAACFPDVQYIEQCQEWQQNYAFENNDHENHLFDVQVIVDNVRAHYDELLKEADENVSVQKEETSTKE